jgi:hypothetical protein
VAPGTRALHPAGGEAVVRAGGLGPSDAQRLKSLEDGNRWLKKLFAEAMLDASSSGSPGWRLDREDAAPAGPDRNADASSTAWLRITPASRTRSYRASTIRYGQASSSYAARTPQLLAEPHVNRTDRRDQEAVAAQLLGNRLDIAGRHALDVHLGGARVG